MGKILITGGNGFVGKRLILNLLSQGHEIYALCRIKGGKPFKEDNPLLHYLWGDLRNPETLNNMPQDIDAAYYLVHSMTDIVNHGLAETETFVAHQFIKYLK